MNAAGASARSITPASGFIRCNSATESVSFWRAGKDAQQSRAGDAVGVVVAMPVCKCMSVYCRRGVHDTQAGMGSRLFNDGWTCRIKVMVLLPISNDADNGTNVTAGMRLGHCFFSN
jgi:hypothetical protein